MSAIAGVIGVPLERQVADNMLKTMARRGPDSAGIWADKMCCLLHTNMTSSDSPGGSQPMRCSWAGEEYTVVFDGVVYNSREISSELEQLGHSISAKSDAELVLHAYIAWDIVALEKLNGVFAFAVWKSNQKELFLARDRIGVKPLFYTEINSGFFFASEIKTLLAHPQIPAKLDSHGIAQLFLLGPGRIPGSGVFHGIRELEPGTCGCYQDGKLKIQRYWKLTDREHTETFEQTADHVRFLVTDAIKRQLPLEGTVGTFLSGGLDSSLISTLCAEELSHRGRKLPTFSLHYKNNNQFFESSKFQPESDDRYIDFMTNHIDSDHHRIVLSPDDLVALLDDATIARDLPGMADVDFSLLALCGEIRKNVKVALSGECADEIFGGYPWYRDPDIRSTEGFPWAQNTGFRAGFIRPEYIKDIDPFRFVMDHYRTTVHDADVLPESSGVDRRMKEMMNLNFQWFMQTLLDRKDRMSMYHGLQARVPFCDYRIAEYLYSVPWEFKDYGDREKGLLRYAMRGILPDEVLYRKKNPYPKTFDPAYQEIVCSMLREVIHDPGSPILQIVRKEALENLLSAKFSWPWYGQLMQLPQTVAYMLQINRWMQLYRVEIL